MALSTRLGHIHSDKGDIKMRIKLEQTEITKGTYMGEQGVGLGLIHPDDFGKPAMGDISRVTSGRLQGYESIIDAELQAHRKIFQIFLAKPIDIMFNMRYNRV